MCKMCGVSDVNTFINSERYKHIQKIQKLAIKYNRCKEKINGKCMYPHCSCLFDKNGLIEITDKKGG